MWILRARLSPTGANSVRCQAVRAGHIWEVLTPPSGRTPARFCLESGCFSDPGPKSTFCVCECPAVRTNAYPGRGTRYLGPVRPQACAGAGPYGTVCRRSTDPKNTRDPRRNRGREKVFDWKTGTHKCDVKRNGGLRILSWGGGKEIREGTTMRAVYHLIGTMTASGMYMCGSLQK